MKERLENLLVGYGINDSFLLASVWEEKCPSPDRLPRILVIFVFALFLFSIIELGYPVLLLCRQGDWFKVRLKMANDDCHFGIYSLNFTNIYELENRRLP